MRVAGLTSAGLGAMLAGCKPNREVPRSRKGVKETVVQEKVVKETVVRKSRQRDVVVEKEAAKQTAAPFAVVHWLEGYLYKHDAKYKP